MPEVQQELPETSKPGARIDRGEVWFDPDAAQTHYILRAAGAWTRHKVVGRDPKRKHFDPKLYHLFAAWLGLDIDQDDEQAQGARGRNQLPLARELMDSLRSEVQDRVPLGDRGRVDRPG